MKKMMMALSLAALTSVAFASPEKITVETVEVKEFQHETKAMEEGETPSIPSVPGFNFNQVGDIIATGKEIVALGEDIYNLVQKGKPSAKTDFAPIAIVPKDAVSKEPVDPFEMENCSMPVQKKYLSTMKTGNMEVVRFEYMVVYTYGCSYLGKGKYIQNAIVQPVSVKASYGWDFNATMKLNGIMNHGTKASPVVGAMLTIKFSMNSWRTAFERNDTIHITGKGDIQNYSR